MPIASRAVTSNSPAAVIFRGKNRFPHLIGSLLLLALPAIPAHALLNLDGSRTQLFVFGGVTFAYSSNIFSDSSARGDSSVTGEVGLEYRRRAGILGVNSTLKFDYQRYATYTGESAFNPNFFIELTKTTGRTTGALTFSAYRESRSDSAVNLRTDAWIVPIGLGLKYPLNDKFYLTSQTGYLRRTYRENPTLVNYTDYSEALDVNYVYTSKLDLSGGYRIRASKTTAGLDTFDHWFNLGASGRLLAKLNGSVRVGYQIRQIDYGENFNQFNAVATLTWPATRKLTFSSQVSRDFNTIATGSSVDSSSVTLRANYAFTRKAELDAGIAYGRNKFLGGPGSVRRLDDFFTWDVNYRYRFNDHLRLALGYTYLQNWSTLSFADFTRQGLSLNLASRF